MLPEYSPYECKIDIESEASLYKGTIYPTSPR